MKRGFIISFIVSLLLPVVVMAQTLTNSQRRHVNSKVLTLVEDYERYATLYDEDAQWYFEELFKNGNSKVLCDMIGSEKYLETVSVKEYTSLLMKYSMNTTITIKDVRKGRMEYIDNKWIIPVTFKKNLSYIDKDGYFFSVRGYHSNDFLVTMTISYNPENDKCQIESLDAVLHSDRKFPEGRFLIVNENKSQDKKYLRYFPDLAISGKEVHFNEYGQAILPSGVPTTKDPDVVVLTDTLNKGFNYDVVDFRFKARNLRLKLRYGIAPMGMYTLENPCPEVSSKSMGHEIGVDAGLCFPLGRSTKLGVYLGAALSMSNLELTLETPISYTYAWTEFDPTHKLFVNRLMDYKVNGASESVRYKDLAIPLYVEFEHKLGRSVMLSWNVGIKGYVSMTADADPFSLAAEADGEPVVLPEPIGYIEPNTYEKSKSFDLSVMAALGADINLWKNQIYFNLSVGYEHGLMSPLYSSPTNQFSSSDGIYPLIYNPVSDSHIPVHSLISGVSFNRSALWISAGFKFKL